MTNAVKARKQAAEKGERGRQDAKTLSEKKQNLREFYLLASLRLGGSPLSETFQQPASPLDR